MSAKTAAKPLKAPFPAFGGKSTIAARVWPRLSTVESPARNYCEPFCFSAAMLLLRPDEPQIETINDVNAFVSNFWRAIQRDPEAVAAHADYPVIETDLHARHAWLVNSDQAHAALDKVRNDPDAYDAKIAGWWCWGACMWIGSGWCDDTHRNSGCEQRPDLDTGQGVTALSQQFPELSGDNGTGRKVHSINGAKIWSGRGSALGHNRGVRVDGKRPQLCIGNSTHGPGVHKKRPTISADGSEFGKGIHANPGDKRPCLTREWSRGTGVHSHDALTACELRRLWLIDWFTRLADRLRPVRVCCGHWARVCDSDSTLTRLGTTAVFLDPPYRKNLACGKVNRSAHIYANDKTQDVNALVDEVQEWCLKWGDNREMRIAVCGLEGEYPKLDAAGWECVAWKSRGGYGNRSNKGKENRERERVWYSPHCLKPDSEVNLFTTDRRVSGAVNTSASTKTERDAD